MSHMLALDRIGPSKAALWDTRHPIFHGHSGCMILHIVLNLQAATSLTLVLLVTHIVVIIIGGACISFVYVCSFFGEWGAPAK